jgi:hypothetical protein
MAVLLTIRRWFTSDADTRIVYFGRGQFVSVGGLIRRVEPVADRRAA